MNNIILFIIVISLLIFCVPIEASYRQQYTREYFTPQLRSYKNRNKRRIRRVIKDGFTQMKSFFP